MDHFTFRIPHRAAGSLSSNTLGDARRKATEGLQNLLRITAGRRYQRIAYIYKLVEVVALGEEPKPTPAPPLRITAGWQWLRDIARSDQEKAEAEAEAARETERLAVKNAEASEIEALRVMHKDTAEHFEEMARAERAKMAPINLYKEHNDRKLADRFKAF